MKSSLGPKIMCAYGLTRFRGRSASSLWVLCVLALTLTMQPAWTQSTELAPTSLELVLAAPSGPVPKGQPIRLDYSLQNRSKGPITLADPSLFPRPTVPQESFGMRLTVVGPNGTQATLVRMDLFAAVRDFDETFAKILQLGDSVEEQIFLGNQPDNHSQWVIHRPGQSTTTEREMKLLEHVFARPGTYRIQASYIQSYEKLPGGLTSDRSKLPHCWAGRLDSPVVEVVVSP